MEKEVKCKMVRIRFTDKEKIDWKALRKKVEEDEKKELANYIECE